MIIVCQNKRRTVNFERIVDFYIYHDKEKHKYLIKATTTIGKEVVLASYTSEMQTNNVYNTLNQSIAFAGNAININGRTQLQVPIYYMPDQIKEKEENK